MQSRKVSLNELIEQSIKNVESDRATVEMLLTDLVIFMKKTGDSAHANSGETASKYLETLQRSNEQLVKIAAIVARQEGPAKGLSEADRNNIFDLIKEK